MSQKKKWSSSAKFEIALLAIKGEATINEICKRYEVSPTQVHAWKKQLVDQGASLFAKNEKAEKSVTVELERKQSKLYEKIGQLTVERDFLKKSWEKLPGNGVED
jgi:transposase